jgi:hypothetical protein
MKTLAGFAAAAAITLLGTPVAASAATLVASPAKSCLGVGDTVGLGGGGYTPNDKVQVNFNGKYLATLDSNAGGNFAGLFQFGEPAGIRTISAIDTSNPANQASLQLRVRNVAISLKPKTGPAGRLYRIRAGGFTAGQTLYLHIRRGHKWLNRRIGKLKGACHTLSVRKRLFSQHTKPGKYRIQFDNKRHYSKKTDVRWPEPGHRSVVVHVHRDS